MEGRAAIHRDLDRMETGANTNLVKFTKDTVPQLGWNNLMQPCRKAPEGPGGQVEHEPLLHRYSAES